MTPKEKAQDLIDTYELLFSGNYLKNRQQMKECALICVDEIIQALMLNFAFNNNEVLFYQKVKSEINDK